MNKYKYLATDIDGTILPYKQKTFDKHIIEMLENNHNKGITNIVVSGRDMVSIGDFIKQLKHIDYFIGANGAFIYDVKKSKFIRENAIYYQEAEKFYDLAMSLKEVYSTSIIDDKHHHYTPNTNTKSWFNDPFEDKIIYTTDNFDKLNRNHLHLITVEFNEEILKDKNKWKRATKKLQKLIKENHLNLWVVSDWARGVYVAKKGVDKAKGLQELMIHLNSSMKEIIAMGDSENDIEMLRDSGYGIVIKNKHNDYLNKVAKIGIDYQDIKKFITKILSK